MNWAFAIHGTPGKSESWGINNDDSYLKSFYDQANNAPESTKLDIDIRIVENVVCTYYNYLKLSNISNGIGRSGGYFGMSIRLAGGYCTDVAGMYQLLDQLYEQVVCKKILRRNGSNAEYCFSSFKECSLELENIASQAKNALEQFATDIRLFPQNFSPNHSGNISRYHINDVGSNSFRDVLFRDAEVYVSKEYPLLADKMAVLDKENKAKSSQINEQQGLINRQSGEISSLNATVVTQNGTIQSYKRTIDGQSAEITGQQKVIGRQKEEISSLNATVATQKGTIQSHKRTIDEQSVEIQRKGEQISSLNRQLSDANRQIEKLNTDIADLQKKLKDALEDKDSKKITECITILTNILNSKQECISLVKNAKTEQGQKLQELDTLKKQLSDIQKAYNKATGTPIDEGDQSLFSFKWKSIVPFLGVVFVSVLLSYAIIGRNEAQEDNLLDKEFAQKYDIFKVDVDNRFKQIDSNLVVLQGMIIRTPKPTIDAKINDYAGKKLWINLKDVTPPIHKCISYTLQMTVDGVVTDCGGKFSFKDENAVMIQTSNPTSCTFSVKSGSNLDAIDVIYYVNDRELVQRSIKVE